MSFSQLVCPWHVLWVLWKMKVVSSLIYNTLPWYLAPEQLIQSHCKNWGGAWGISYRWTQELSSIGGFKLMCRKASMVCAAGVPQMLTVAHKEAREEITAELCTVQEARVFCPKLSKRHEIGVYCFELKSKQQLMGWCHITSQGRRNSGSALSPWKILDAVFWDEKCVSFVYVLSRGDNSKFWQLCECLLLSS